METSRRSKLSKIAVTVEPAVKSTKAQDILAKRKVDAAKATLPPLEEKSTKLLKVNETMARRKAEAAKVAAAEREKKKMLDPSPVGDADKKQAPKKGLWKLRIGEGMLQSRKRGQMKTSPLGKGRGLTWSQRLMRMLTSCRRLRSNLALTILREGQRRN
jgi:hypothetical protein